MFVNVSREISGRSGQSGNIFGRGLKCGCVSPPTRPRDHCILQALNCVGELVEISNHVQLHHQNDQAFPIFRAKH